MRSVIIPHPNFRFPVLLGSHIISTQGPVAAMPSPDLNLRSISSRVFWKAPRRYFSRRLLRALVEEPEHERTRRERLPVDLYILAHRLKSNTDRNTVRSQKGSDVAVADGAA